MYPVPAPSFKAGRPVVRPDPCLFVDGRSGREARPSTKHGAGCHASECHPGYRMPARCRWGATGEPPRIDAASSWGAAGGPPRTPVIPGRSIGSAGPEMDWPIR